MSNQIDITGGARVRGLNGVITGTTGVLNSLPINSPNGIPQLDSSGKILVSQLPNSVMEFLGTWNAATNTPTLADGTGNAGDVYLCNVAGTVNFGSGPITFQDGDYVVYSGSTWERSGGAMGTVTSVAASITGNSVGITGSPITTAGTLAFAFAGTNLQYVNGSGNLTTFPTLITSIGLSMPTAFTVTNSPLTANGTISVTGAGTASQYIRGDGQLATFPSGGGGGSSVYYYLNGSIPSSVAGYEQMANTAIIGTGTDFNKTGNGLIAQFLTDAGNPNRTLIPSGAWTFEMFFNSSSNGGNPKFYVELVKYNGSTFTIIASSSANPEAITGGTTTDLYITSIAVPETTLLTTDRLAVRVYIVDNSGGRTITLHTEDSNLCQVTTTFSAGISSLNGLNANTQYLAVGTAGSDFNINSLVDTHTFNLPTASATKRGALSSADWSLFNGKENVLTFSSPLIRTLNAVSIQAANTSQSGYLTATDWNLFKIAYNDSIISAAVTGTTTKTLTLNQQDGGTVTASWTDYDTAPVTSVFGRTGAVVAASGDYTTTEVTEGTRLYFTNLRASSALGLTTTGTSGAASYNDITGVFNIPQYQAALTNPVTGTGTTNYIPKFTGSTAIGNSVIYDTGTNVLIGTTTDGGYKLLVNGTSNFVGASIFNSSVQSTDFRYTGNGYLTYDTDATGTNTMQIRSGFAGAVLTFNGVGAATFTSSIKINQLGSEIQQIINSNASSKPAITQYQVNSSAGWEVGMASLADSYSYIFSYGTFGTTNAMLTLTNTGAASFASSVTATSLIKSGGTSAQILAADGSVITAGTNITISGGTISASGGGGGSMAIGGSITGATTGSVLFVNSGATLAQDNANFFWDDTNNRLGLGTTTPSVNFQVTTASAAIPRGVIFEQKSADTNAFLMTMRKSRGAGAAVNGDNIGNWYADAFDGTQYTSGSRIRFSIDGAVSNGVVPTSFQIFTGTGSVGGTERFRVTSGGLIGINTSTIGSQLQVNGNAAIGYSNSTAAPALGLAVAGDIQIGATKSFLGTAGSYFYIGYIAANGPNINMSSPTRGGGPYFISYDHDGGHRFSNSNESSVWMTINSSGNLGLGTTTFGASKFQVNGNAAIGYSASTAAPTNGLAVAGAVTIGTATNNVSSIITTGYSLTGANAQSLLDLAGTWNTTGQPTAIKLNITNTASGTGADLMELQIGGVNQLRVTKGGAGIFTGVVTSTGFASSGISGGSNIWNFGTITTATAALDTTKYLTINVNGVDYKLALII